MATVDSALPIKDYGNLEESVILYDPPPKYDIEDELMQLVDYMILVLKTVKLTGSFDGDSSSKEFAPKSKNVKLQQIVEDMRVHVLTAGNLAILK